MSVKVLISAGVVSLLLLIVWKSAFRNDPHPGSFASVWDGPLRDELFLDTSPGIRAGLLEEWRWKVGHDAEVFQVTVFGDLFTRTPDGRVYWLDTGTGRYAEAAENTQRWTEAARIHGPEWFHWNTLRDLRSRGVRLAEGQVYSWRVQPMLGGTESVDNIDLTPLQVHVSNTGRVAQAAKDLPPGAKVDRVEFEVLGPEDGDWRRTGPGGEDLTIYQVVINEELQYSIWPAGEAVPAPWKSEGKTGTKQECLDYIAEVWTDMRPLSLRKGDG